MRNFDKERICDKVKDALPEIMDKPGLSTNGLENLHKIVTILESLKNMEYMDLKWEYYESVLAEMKGRKNEYYRENGDYSERRDSRGRYSGADGRMMPDYGRDSSYANRGEHYVRGHYSRSDGRDPYIDYMDGKQSYRNSGKSEECKKRMLEALEDHLEMLTKEINEMGQDADCREERETIKRYVDKLRSMM